MYKTIVDSRLRPGAQPTMGT